MKERYTSARRLVLSRRQKTRGRLSLFLAYDTASSEILWPSWPDKDSTILLSLGTVPQDQTFDQKKRPPATVAKPKCRAPAPLMKLI
jgi:hypothetical protein